jgi:hypothetical protein
MLNSTFIIVILNKLIKLSTQFLEIKKLKFDRDRIGSNLFEVRSRFLIKSQL